MTAQRDIASVKDKYRSSEELDLAVLVAVATRRPLLLFGDPGSGKSSLARYVASRDELRYYEHVITSRTSARDLLWTFDNVRRLGDAQASTLQEDEGYIRPGVLWWAFDRAGAFKMPKAPEPHAEWNSGRASRGSVVLVDEIDKADPDLPNSLLVPLGDRRFDVTDLQADRGRVVESADSSCLVVITSNEERDLPPAFIRRCVVFRVPPHDSAALEEIADRHFGPERDYPLHYLVSRVLEARSAAGRERRHRPSTAEFLDAVRACVAHGVRDEEHESLAGVVRLVLDKDVRDDEWKYR